MQFAITLWITMLEGKAVDVDVYRSACNAVDERRVVGYGEPIPSPLLIALESALRPWLGIVPTFGVLYR